VELPRGVLVHDEEPPGDGRHGPDGLGRAVGGSFGPVATEVVVFHVVDLGFSITATALEPQRSQK
jgi:hypothetical protein